MFIAGGVTWTGDGATIRDFSAMSFGGIAFTQVSLGHAVIRKKQFIERLT
jgi:hypothetical protein